MKENYDDENFQCVSKMTDYDNVIMIDWSLKVSELVLIFPKIE